MIAYIMKYLNQDSLRQRDLSLSKEKKYSNLERNAHEYMSQPFRLISYRYKMRNCLDASALKNMQ